MIKMKKVIITTFFKAENYGAMLQAYALQTLLLKLGYDVEILNYRDSAIEDVYKINSKKKQNIYLTIRSFLRKIIFYKQRKKRHNQFLNFQRKYLKIGDKEYWLVEEIKRDPPEADIYITGSDQVWNSSITKGVSDVYTLNFGHDKTRRIAYAASIGTTQISPNEIGHFKEKISVIDDISVREATAKNVLEQLLVEKTIDVALDPVLLRSKGEWQSDLPELDGEKEKYILAYHVEESPEYRKIVKYLSEVTALKIIHFEIRKKYDNVLYSAYTKGPMEFVNLIKNAEYIITTSFHGTAFSIVFHKKFWVVPHKFTGTRVTDMLEKFGIQDRAVCTLEKFKKKEYDQEIDYVKVAILLEKERKNSLQWLRTAMGEKDF